MSEAHAITTKRRNRTRDVFTSDDNSSRNYFGETLREFRVSKNLTQQDAANKLGVTQSQWSSYENGTVKLNLDILVTIAEKFEVSPMVLIGKSVDKKFVSDPVLELTFEEYEIGVKEAFEKFRKETIRKKVEDRLVTLRNYIAQ